MRKIIIAMCAYFMLILFTLTGCAPRVEMKPIILQEVLLKKCTKDTPVPEIPARDIDGKIMLDEEGKTLYDGKETMRVLIKWDDIYSDCAMTHDALVDVIRNLQEANKIETKK